MSTGADGGAAGFWRSDADKEDAIAVERGCRFWSNWAGICASEFGNYGGRPALQ